MQAQDHYTALRGSVQKHLSGAEHSSNGKEIVISRNHFIEVLMKRSGSKNRMLMLRGTEKNIPKLGALKLIATLLQRSDTESFGIISSSEDASIENTRSKTISGNLQAPNMPKPTAQNKVLNLNSSRHNRSIRYKQNKNSKTK